MHDVRASLRLLWKDKAFTATAILTLAVCIAGNTALFTVVDHLLLRPLRVPEAHQVVLVYNSFPKAGAPHASASVVDYLERLEHLAAFEEQALFNTRQPSLDLNGTPERIRAMQVTPSFFRLIRVAPAAGRGFTDEEAELGRNRVVVLSEALRARLFPQTEPLGQAVRIDGTPHTVVGVMPAAFTILEERVDAWLPLAFTEDERTARYSNSWAHIGRLRPGATLAQVQAQVDALNAANLERVAEARQVVETTGFHSVATLLQEDQVREVRPMLYLLWGGAMLVLLIGAVNVAGLVLVRSRMRMKEFATRLALGADRWRIVRQLVVEHVILTMVAAAVGVTLADLTLQVLGATVLEQLPHGAEIALDGRVLATAFTAALAIGVLVGAVPVLAGLPTNLTTMLRDEGRSATTGPGVRLLRRSLVVAQVALAFVLVIGAGLLFASFRRVLMLPAGFDSSSLLTASVALPQSRYADDAALQRFAEEALRRVRAYPGVIAAGATTSIPFGNRFSQNIVLPEGARATPGQGLVGPYTSRVTTGYFEAMKVRLRAGRFFDERDAAESAGVVILDEQLARRFWPNDPAEAIVGRRVFEPSDISGDIYAVDEDTDWFTVIGVVGEVKLRGLVEGVGDTGAYYLPHMQRPGRFLTFTIRTAGDPMAMAAGFREQLRQVDRELPIFDLRSMEERSAHALVTRRAPMLLALAFGGVALFLAAIGIYGVLAYLVAQRTREIGIRMALGSSRGAVMQLVVREGALLVGGGLMMGAVGAAALSRGVGSVLYGVEPTNPLVLAAAIAVLAGAGAVASVVPARRAAAIEPIVALSE